MSLSSPMTGVLRELQLLQDPQLQAVSLFHPLTAAEFTGTRLGGGLFLSKKDAHQYQDSVVYFDQSSELSRRLRKLPFKERNEVHTRGEDPFKISQRALAVLKKHLDGCDAQVAKFQSWIDSERNFLLAKPPFQGTVFFFLGPIRAGKWPALLIVKDGPVQFWQEHHKLKTYQSPLSYVSWGEKWKASLTGDERMVGLVQPKPEVPTQLETLGNGQFNFHDSMALSPGPWQIHFMRRFVERLP